MLRQSTDLHRLAKAEVRSTAARVKQLGLPCHTYRRSRQELLAIRKKEQTALMGSQSQMLLNQVNSFPCQLRDHHTCDGHGMGMQDHAFLLPCIKMQSPSVDNSQYPEKTRKSGYFLKELLALDDPALVRFSKVIALCNLSLFPGEDDINNNPDAAHS